MAEQDADASAFQIGCDDVKFGVGVDVGDCESPNSSARQKRRAWCGFEVAAAVAQHDADTFTGGGKRIKTAVTIHVCKNHLKGAAAKVERRAGGFRKMTWAIAEQHSQLALLVMSGHHIYFAIAVYVADSSEPGLTGTQG